MYGDRRIGRLAGAVILDHRVELSISIARGRSRDGAFAPGRRRIRQLLPVAVPIGRQNRKSQSC